MIDFDLNSTIIAMHKKYNKELTENLQKDFEQEKVFTRKILFEKYKPIMVIIINDLQRQIRLSN